MLSSDFPFYNDEQILNDQLQFRHWRWRNVSPETRQFVGTILLRARVFRPTVSQLLQNQWFTPKIIQLAHKVMGIQVAPPEELPEPEPKRQRLE